MKKLLLSTIVMLSFGFYVFWQNINNRTSNVAKPTITTIVPTNIKKGSGTTTTASTINNPPKMMNGGGMMKGTYKDGTYIGNSVDAYYGYVQVQVAISGGKIVDVVFLDYPQDAQNSIRINSRAMPILIRETLTAQSANVNAVSGASETSPAYIQSLKSALAQAKV